MRDFEALKAQFFRALGGGYSGEALFDQVPDTVYFLKDRAGRYMAVNNTLVERCGRASKEDLIGHMAEELFPAPLGELITAQDRQVLAEARSIKEKLELHLYPGGREGWCLTWKEPLRDRSGTVVGLSGISRDLQAPAGLLSDAAQISSVLDHIQDNVDQPLRQPELAAMAGLSAYQLDQRVRALFGVTAGQYVTRARIERACHRLRNTDDPISQVALDCGYGDQAAFSRQFRQSVGLAPAAYRNRMR